MKICIHKIIVIRVEDSFSNENNELKQNKSVKYIFSFIMRMKSSIVHSDCIRAWTLNIEHIKPHI